MFIRTKDGIYEVIKEEILCGVKFYDYETREDFVNRIREEYIINQSDTIDELCDVYVMISEEYDLPQLVCKMNFDYVKRKCKAIYGAIWTSKGLIFVSEYDKEKGKMELL